MIVRTGTEEDLPALISIYRKLLGKEVPDDKEVLQNFVLACDVMLVENEDKIIAAFFALFHPDLWQPEKMCINEQGCWVDENAPRSTLLILTKEIRRRLKIAGVTRGIARVTENSPPSLERFWENLGLKQHHVVYIGDL